MAHLETMSVSDPRPAPPVVRRIRLIDVRDALASGVEDFWAIPTHAIFLIIIYPIVGLVLARLTFSYDVLPLLFPLMSGFALIGPLAALGLYELSRRREQGLDVSWEHAFGVLRSESIYGILALGCLLMVIFVIWIAAAHAVYVATFGNAPAATIPDFIERVFTTPAGWKLIILGNGIGFLFALLVLTISVVSFPLLLDRDVSAGEAVRTSVRVVRANPIPMAAWGMIVAGLLALGSLTLFLGLAIVLPVLGHATWHLYRKVVEPDPTPRKQAPVVPKQRRYAAQFPASLLGRESRRRTE